MTTLAEMQAQLDHLRNMRTWGERRARFDDREVEYRSDAELAAAIGDLEIRIAAALRPGPRVIHPSVSKGY